MKAKHKHKVKERQTYGFSHCVAIWPHTICRGNSHGGTTTIETCCCGAKRYMNSTGSGKDERSPWVRGTMGALGLFTVLKPGERADESIVVNV